MSIKRIKSRFLFIIFTILLVSCFNNDLKRESPYKGEILNYLKQLKGIANETQSKKIDELVSAIDFTTAGIHKLRTTEKAVIADLRSMDSFDKSDKLKVIFYLNQNEIVRSTIVTFNDKVRPKDYDQVILSVLNMDVTSNNYSGKISFYGPFQHLMLFDDFENGKLNVNGIAHKSTTKDEAGRVAGCTDWYLVTTYYYSDESTSTTSLYLYTSCPLTGCENQAYRVGRITGNCSGGTSGGGSGSAGSALTFPTAPKNNDTYEFTDKDGKYTKYVFNSQTNYWTIVEVILPPVVVLSAPDSYPFLQIQYPVNDQVVYGTDNLIYHYNGSTGNWVGVTCIRNQLTTPCLNLTAEKVLNPDLVSKYNNWIQDVFNSSDKVNLILKEGPLPPNKTAATDPLSSKNGIIDVIVTLDPAKLINGSQQFIAATIYHECFHALTKYLSNGNFSSDDQHIAMFTIRLDLLASSLDAAYPGMQYGDSKGLILAGLLAMDGGDNPDPGEWTTDFVNEILAATKFSRVQVTTIYKRYQVYKTSGTRCN